MSHHGSDEVTAKNSDVSAEVSNGVMVHYGQCSSLTLTDKIVMV